MECCSFNIINDKIQQVVNYGSVALALQEKYFSKQQLLNWLLIQPFTNKTEIAYYILCNNLHPDNHQINDSHFVLRRAEYIPIAMIFNLNISLLEQYKNVSIDIDMVKFNTNIEKLKFLLLLRKGESNDTNYTRENLNNLYHVRKFNYIKYLTTDEINKSLVNTDWIEKFRYNSGLINYIIERVKLLKEKANNYYNDLIYSKYTLVIEKLYRSKYLHKLSKDDFILLNNLFPNIINNNIFSYNNLGFKLFQISTKISGYLLGFPIHIVIPTDEQIQKQIKLLCELGTDKYIDQVKEYTKKMSNIVLPSWIETKFINNTNVLTEDIDEYLPFDIIVYQTGEHIYRFTRPEFDSLLKSKKNPYTNEYLPKIIIENIRSRSYISKLCNLPEAKIYKELLTELENGTLLSKIEIRYLNEFIPSWTVTETSFNGTVTSHTLEPISREEFIESQRNLVGTNSNNISEQSERESIIYQGIPNIEHEVQFIPSSQLLNNNYLSHFPNYISSSESLSNAFDEEDLREYYQQIDRDEMESGQFIVFNDLSTEIPLRIIGQGNNPELLGIIRDDDENITEVLLVSPTYSNE